MIDKGTKGNGRRLFSLQELDLKNTPKIFYAHKKDVLSLPSDINKNGIFRGEYAYIIEKKELDNNEFYRKQTPHIRYVDFLYIIDETEKVLQKIPIIAVTSGKKGAYFVIDRQMITEEG